MAMKRRRKQRKAKRRTVALARRHNPVPVIFANPKRRRRRKASKRRRTSGRRRSNSLVIRSLPVIGRRTRRKRRKNPTRGHRRARLYRRRHNPGRLTLSNLKHLAGVGLFGGLGIVTARIGGMLYRDHVAKYVLGASPSPTRATISDVVRLAAMGAMTLGVEMGIRKTHMVGPTHVLAFRIGGLAETGRQAVGLVVNKLQPGSSITKWGLDGYGRHVGPGCLPGRGLAGGLEDADSFMGAALEPVGSFDGYEDELQDEHPYADLY